MITVGYWCDHCRVKYVRHVCKERTLPCGHPFQQALPVWCKHFARSGENVQIDGVGFWVREKKQPNMCYFPGGRYYWENVVDLESGETMVLAEFLRERGPVFASAFDARWQSEKEPPDWVKLMRDEPAYFSELHI